MDPVTGAALISAGSSLIGGLLGRKGQKDANAQNEALQREFAQNGIRWKVADAKAAGLHPLFALGGSGATYTPAAQSVMAPMASSLDAMGQNVSRAMSAQQTTQERQANELQLELLRSQINKNNTEAAAVASESQRAWQSTWMAKPLNLDGSGVQLGDGKSNLWALSADAYGSRGYGRAAQDAVMAPSGRVKNVPDEVISDRPGAPYVTAGRHTGMMEYQWPGLGPVMLPRGDSGSGPGEVMGELSWYLWPEVYRANKAHYGDAFDERLLRHFLGERGARAWKGGPAELFRRGRGGGGSTW